LNSCLTANLTHVDITSTAAAISGGSTTVTADDQKPCREQESNGEGATKTRTEENLHGMYSEMYLEAA